MRAVGWLAVCDGRGGEVAFAVFAIRELYPTKRPPFIKDLFFLVERKKTKPPNYSAWLFSIPVTSFCYLNYMGMGETEKTITGVKGRYLDGWEWGRVVDWLSLFTAARGIHQVSWFIRQTNRYIGIQNRASEPRFGRETWMSFLS